MNIRIPSLEEVMNYKYVTVPEGTIPPAGSVARQDKSFYVISKVDHLLKHLYYRRPDSVDDGIWGFFSDVHRWGWKWYIPKKKVMLILNEED